MIGTGWDVLLANVKLLVVAGMPTYFFRPGEEAARGESADPVGESGRSGDPGPASTPELDAALATLSRSTGLSDEEILRALLDAVAARRPRAS
jgi:hypothetical protein